jgi:hypothetical protein
MFVDIVMLTYIYTYMNYEYRPLDPEAVFSALDEALQEMGYDLDATAAMLASRDLPVDLVALVARKVASRPG